MNDNNVSNDFTPQQLAWIARLSGVALAPERLAQVIEAYLPILAEIERLRECVPPERHPAIVFEPTAPYRRI